MAKAEVTGQPVYRADDAVDLWLDSRGAAPDWRLPMKVLETRTGESAIMRTWLEEDASFKHLRILRFRSETNYRLTDAELGRLNAMWEAAKDSSMKSPEADAFPEGRLTYVCHLRRERNQALVEAAKRLVLEKEGQLRCSVCGFSFEETYGEPGRGFIEMHHVVPISQLVESSVTHVSDLVPVCSNCHRMLHRRRPWVSVADLKTILLSATEARA